MSEPESDASSACTKEKSGSSSAEESVELPSRSSRADSVALSAGLDMCECWCGS